MLAKTLRCIDTTRHDVGMGTTTKRDKWAEALAAYNSGTAGSLPADNPYRWLVQNHDGNNQHQGMQPSCPACGDVR